LPSPSSVVTNFSPLNGSMPSNAKDNHWKIPPSKSPAAAATPASSWSRPKQSIPGGKPLCNPTSGNDAAGGGPINHQQNLSGPERGNLCPFGRQSVFPPYRPHDQQRQPHYDFPPALSPAFTVPGGPGGRRLHSRGEGASGLGSDSINGGRSGAGISRVFGHGCSAPIGETTPHSDRRIPGPRGESSSSRPTSTHQRQLGDVAAAIFARTTDGFGVISPGNTQAFDAQASSYQDRRTRRPRRPFGHPRWRETSQ
jgi:hypothetical protein